MLSRELSPALARYLEEHLKSLQANPEAPWPEVDDALLAFLEARYPARTLGRMETVEDHLRYAGAVELIETMRAVHEAAKEADADANNWAAEAKAELLAEFNEED